MSKKTYRIEGMHCSSCAMAVDWALEDVPGVSEARTSFPTSRVEVTFDGPVDDSVILAAINEAGYRGFPQG